MKFKSKYVGFSDKSSVNSELRVRWSNATEKYQSSNFFLIEYAINCYWRRCLWVSNLLDAYG
jgi:hypothetical protein